MVQWAPRKKLFDEQTARWLVMERRDEGKDGKPVRTLKEFAAYCRFNGITPHVVSPQTLANIFSGKMYPLLKDENGRPFDWHKIPRGACGRRTTSLDKTAPYQLEKLRESIEEMRADLSRVLLALHRLLPSGEPQ